MQIGVYGLSDKRPVIYALLKILQATGDTALLSNNRQYLRLLEMRESPGHFNNVLISVSDASPDEIFDEIGYAPDDFDHIIYDLQDTVPDNLAVRLYLKSYPQGEDEETMLDLLGDYRTIKLTFDQKKEKEAINLAPLPTLWRTVEQIESFKMLLPLPSKPLNKGLSRILAPFLGMKERSAMQLLTRGWKR